MNRFQSAINYAQHARDLLNDGEYENADGLLGNCIATLEALSLASPKGETSDASDVLWRLISHIHHCRNYYSDTFTRANQETTLVNLCLEAEKVLGKSAGGNYGRG